MRKAIHVSVDRKPGGLSLSTVHRGRYFHRLYVLYPRREAIADFRRYVRWARNG